MPKIVQLSKERRWVGVKFNAKDENWKINR